MKIAQGEDPASEKRKAIENVRTLGTLAENYFDNYVKVHNKPQTIKKYRSYLDQYVLPRFGSKLIEKVGKGDVREILNISLGPKGDHKTTANRVLAMLKKMFNYALVELEWIQINPCLGLKMHKEKSRDRWASPDELQNLAKSIEKETDPYYKGFYMILIYTGCRREEARLMRWDDVNLKDRIWKLLNTKNDRVHEVHLNDQALEVLNSIPRQPGPYVFAGNKAGEPINGVDKAWIRVLDRAGLMENIKRAERELKHAEGARHKEEALQRLKEAKRMKIRLHDIRRTVGSYLAQNNISIHAIGSALNHRSSDTTKVYARLGSRSQKEVFDEIGRTMEAVVRRSAAEE